MTKKTLLILHSLLQAEMEELENEFNLIRLNKENDPERAIREHKDDIVGIIATHSVPVRKSLIDVLPNLEIIANFAVGTDNIDLQAAAERKIAVTNTPDVLSEETADLAMALMLSIARRIVEADMFVRVGRWQNKAFPLGVSLSGKRLGIVGLGRIGRFIAKKAEAFNMDILYHGRSEKTDVSYTYYADLKEMAASCDFLMLACPGTPQTENLITYEILEALGPKGYIINIARGSVVNEEDLLIALRNEAIAGAALDVYTNEPNVPEGLLKMDNVVLLPHIGSATFETRTAMGQLVLANIRAHFAGEPLPTEVKG